MQDARALVESPTPFEEDSTEAEEATPSVTRGDESDLAGRAPTELADAVAGAAVTDGLRTVEAALRNLESSVERFQQQSVAHEDLVQRMQQRIDELQGDQVRALLSPVYEELASLQADLADAASREWSGANSGQLAKELAYLVTRVDSALHLLGLESVGAAPGMEFDSRRHAAARRVPTGDPALDRRIERVYRQGFSFPGAKKVSMHARVTVYEFDPALGDGSATDPQPSPLTEPSAEILTTPGPPDSSEPPGSALDPLSPPRHPLQKVVQ